MRDIPFDRINLATLQALRDEGIGEGRHLELKRELPGATDSDKKEFAADVSSFANAGGGDIVYGVEEERDPAGKNTGRIGRFCGLGGFNFDHEQRRLEAILRTGVDPRIPAIRMRAIEGGDGGPLLLVRVPLSSAGPHMVTVQQQGRFYSRTSAGKHPLDVRELRDAFVAASSATARAREFRMDRIAKIVANETPIALGERPRLVLHIVPLARAAESARDVTANGTDHVLGQLKPIMSSQWNTRRNLDGFLAYAREMGGIGGDYTLLFRSGAVEAVCTDISHGQVSGASIPGGAVEDLVVKSMIRYAKVVRSLAVDVPLSLSASLIGVRDVELAGARDYGRGGGHRFDRAEILLPDILLEDESLSADELQPMLDIMWQAAGWEGSPSRAGVSR